MKAWKHISGVYHDIQDTPNPLPGEYNSEEWELVEISEAELAALAKSASYTHSERGIKDLLVETPIIITHNLEEFV